LVVHTLSPQKLGIEASMCDERVLGVMSRA